MFNGIWLVASEPLTIQGREVQSGERFEISRIKSGALLVMGRAMIAPRVAVEPLPERPAPRKRGRPRKTPIPDTSASIDLLEPSDAEPTSRRYRRRDLEAEP